MGSFGIRRLNGMPLVNPDGTTTVYCRKCGRAVARRIDSRLTSIAECLICQGYPEEAVKQQYTQTNPFSAPVPINDPEWMYLSEDPISKNEEKIGLPHAMFQAVGNFANSLKNRIKKKKKAKVAESTQIARRKRGGGAFEPLDPNEEEAQ